VRAQLQSGSQTRGPFHQTITDDTTTKWSAEHVSAFSVGQHVKFAGHGSVVVATEASDSGTLYVIENGPERLRMRVPSEVLSQHNQADKAAMFESREPHLLAVDDFFRDPDQVRQIALAQQYNSDLRFYKGLRSDQRFLWPFLREEFSRLLGLQVVNWLEHTANGVFQLTNPADPLVWHHDSQGYAAAVYLTPDPPAGSGTPFWRERQSGCRRGPNHPLERTRLGNDAAVKSAESIVYDPYNFEHEDTWELVESIAGLYNRLVIWDAKLIHSATSYNGFVAEGKMGMRLVQLFFFDVAL
jgi:hypothetical protein